MKIQQYLKKVWFSITLRQKLGVYTAMVILIMACSGAFSLWVVDFATEGFQQILEDNSKCHDFEQAMEEEVQAFSIYLRDNGVENRDAYTHACAKTERCLMALPKDFMQIGENRMARTWSILSSYEQYRAVRNRFFALDPEQSGYIPELYRIYSMQNYIQRYAKRLTEETLKAGNLRYEKKRPSFSKIPGLIMIVAIILTVFSLQLTRLLLATIIRPIMSLARSSRKIAENDFSEGDVIVKNHDEVGELVVAFNRMKHATEGYINTLKKNNEMAELLHREEVERIEMERQLNTAQLELLKSQINPHFLFNTLNIIGCMAKIEDAETTERMITSLSSLFRYNLKTSEQFVPLAQELKIVQDYIYIQQMRFGDRLEYQSRIEVDAETVVIPSFSLQPIVENAVVHGISKKEEGGILRLHIWWHGDCVVISVMDTGVGMDTEKLNSLKAALQKRRTAKIGIGLGNIYKRMNIFYEDGSLRVGSIAGFGTIVQMKIPQKQS